MVDQPKIYATLAWGFAPERWGAIGFSQESVRNRLAQELRSSDGLVLTMGTMGEETVEAERGRLLGLHTLGTRPVATEELVEPGLWASHIADNGGSPKWPYGLPIIAAQRFTAPPLRARLLPRLHEENLHRKLAANFELLTDDEVAAVLACGRESVSELWSSPKGSFVSHVLPGRPTGPPPVPGERLLSARSGPAATYCFRLNGQALAAVARGILGWPSDLVIYKVGFSNDPSRRLRELNAYLPDEGMLGWTHAWAQWHRDEINAWAMEQAVFRILASRKAKHIKGEIFAVREADMQRAFWEAQAGAQRPHGPVMVTSGAEERIATSPKGD